MTPVNTHVNKVLIDADSMVYIQAWDVKELENNPENYALVIHKTDGFVNNILNATGAERYIGFLKGAQPTFRHIANPDYKAKRKGNNEWLDKWGAVIKHRLISKWGFIQVEGMEAEDAVNIMANCTGISPTIIAHIDKDLDQIPGFHYNYKKLTSYTVNKSEAERNLFVQVVMGDNTDNIPGITGVGAITAKRLLVAGLAEYHSVALEAFIQNYGERNGIISFYESYLMCKLLDQPYMGFDPKNIKWVDFVPDETFIPSPEEIVISWEVDVVPPEKPVKDFNPTNSQPNHEHYDYE